MKKFCCMILALLLCLAACGCQMDNEEPKKPTEAPPTQSTTNPYNDLPVVTPTDPDKDPPIITPTDPDNDPPIITPTDPDKDPPIITPTDPDDEQPTLAPTKPIVEYETILLDEPQNVYGKITGKNSSNVFEFKVFSNITWGETVCIITDQADEFCVGDEIGVVFSKLERPVDESKYMRIYVDDIYTLAAPEKPIIYLYPETPTQCSVKLTLKGELTCTYPNHGATGWNNFTAYPDGTLIFPDGKEYYALYWEGIQAGQWDFSKGFCVPGEDTAKFLEWALAEQGLTRREANEFIVYWLPLMQDNPYNVISFQTTAYTDGAVLDIQPAPDAMLRVFMAYYPTDNEVEIQPQAFEEFIREGFTVVEWGGSQVKKP